MNRSPDQYAKALAERKYVFPALVIKDNIFNLKPLTTTEVTIYHQWCLDYYRKRYYRPTADTIIPVVPFNMLQQSFDNQYDKAIDKQGFVQACSLNTLNDILQITAAGKILKEQRSNREFQAAVRLYQCFTNSKPLDDIYRTRLTQQSHLLFKRYALSWDLARFKAYLATKEESAPLEAEHINFGLNDDQLLHLYKKLKGKFIDNSTTESVFLNWFRTYPDPNSEKLKYIKLSQHKLSGNKILLLRLTLGLLTQDFKINPGRRIVTEAYEFINMAFINRHMNYEKTQEVIYYKEITKDDMAQTMKEYKKKLPNISYWKEIDGIVKETIAVK